MLALRLLKPVFKSLTRVRSLLEKQGIKLPPTMSEDEAQSKYDDQTLAQVPLTGARHQRGTDPGGKMWQLLYPEIQR